MKKLILCLPVLLSLKALAYNQGLSCITYLSKSGGLEPAENEKYDHSDFEKILDYDKTHFGGERPRVRKIEPFIFANNLSVDKNHYPALEVEGQDLMFQNGIFYI